MAYDLDTTETAPASSPFIPVVQIVVDVADLLLRRWWLALLGIAIGAGYAYHVSAKLPDQYVAQVKFIVDEPTGPSTVQGADPNDVLADRRMNLQRRVEAIRSIPVADTVQRILTGKLDAKAGNLMGEIAALPTPGAEGSPAKVQDLVDNGLEERLKDPAYLSSLIAIRSNIQVAVDVDSSMLTIAEYGSDPNALPIRPNTYFQAYRAHCLAQKTAYDRRALRAIQGSLEFGRQLLARADTVESTYRRKNNLPPRGQAAHVSISTSAELARRLPAQTGPQPSLSARAEKSIQMRQTLLQEALHGLEQLLDLQDEFTADHPSVTAKQLEILGLLDSMVDPDTVSANSAALSSQTYEQQLAAEAARTGSGASTEHAAFVLGHTVSIADAIYSAVLSQQREIQVRNALAVPDVHLVEPATVPTMPVGPDRAKTIRNGAGAGFALVFFLLLLLEYGDARVKGVNSIAKIAGSQVIATFAYDSELDQRPAEESIVVQEGNFSPLAESMRELRTRLMFSGQPTAGKALLVTSAFSGDGKTFIASNLAVSLAQVGERVLLIDGDLRKPRLHQVFGVPNIRGFTDLVDQSNIHELVRPCLLPNLHLLPSGPPIAAPAEFLSRGRTQEVLRALLTKYDRVIFDTPPINLVADASNLAALVDTAVLVIRDGGCTESELAAAAERVRRSSVSLAGVVLNHLRTPVITYGASSYGKKYYPSLREPVQPSNPSATGS